MMELKFLAEQKVFLSFKDFNLVILTFYSKDLNDITVQGVSNLVMGKNFERIKWLWLSNFVLKLGANYIGVRGIKMFCKANLPNL